ncbi:MAG TPA: general secretion pathway protein GspC, partial [Leptospiraceae bacterium]|nr:general secretion pathway protein GspC [Leptospiraceae bacterium]
QGATKINITRDRLLASTKNPEMIYQNKFAPVTRDGKVLGLKLLFVPQGNFLYELGARSGDIIRRFNGEPLENQDRMIQMWQSLQSANRITIEVERGGKVIPFEILIQ